jgi:hypothetical protein
MQYNDKCKNNNYIDENKGLVQETAEDRNKIA